jgi:hypothetical protein
MRWWRRKAREHDLKRELPSDLELEAAAQQEGGLSEDVREVWGWAAMEHVWQDLRYAARTLRKSPGFTVATVLTLALGISANSAIFSIVNGVLLKPLPFARADQLVEVFVRDAQGQRQYVSQPDLDDWRVTAHTFTGLASWVAQSVNLTGLDQPNESPESSYLRISCGCWASRRPSGGA